MLIRYTLDPPPNLEGFRNLSLVYLVHVRFNANMSFGPQLNQLTLIQCFRVHHLGRQFTHNTKNLEKVELLRDETLEMYEAYHDKKDPIKGCLFNLHLGSFCLVKRKFHKF